MLDLPKPLQDTLKIQAICSDLDISEDDTELFLHIYTLFHSVDPKYEQGEAIFEDPNNKRITEIILQLYWQKPVDALTQGVRQMAKEMGYENALSIPSEKMMRMFTDPEYRAETYKFFRDYILSKMDEYDMDDVMDAAVDAEFREEDEIKGLEDSL